MRSRLENRTISHGLSGVDSMKSSFRRKIETTELFGTRGFVPLVVLAPVYSRPVATWAAFSDLGESSVHR